MAFAKRYPKHALLMPAASAVMVTIGYFTRNFSIEAQAHPDLGFDRHAVIAITCPYPPYFGIGGKNSIEWQLIDDEIDRDGHIDNCHCLPPIELIIVHETIREIAFQPACLWVLERGGSDNDRN